jgi:hypothetical protein
MNNPDHIFEGLKTIFWVKILKFFAAYPEWKIRTRDPGINIPDPRHCIDVYLRFELGGDSGVEVAAGACCC